MILSVKISLSPYQVCLSIYCFYRRFVSHIAFRNVDKTFVKNFFEVIMQVPNLTGHCSAEPVSLGQVEAVRPNELHKLSVSLP